MRHLFAVVAPLAVLAACTGTAEPSGTTPRADEGHVERTSEALAAKCTASVAGHGVLDVEDVYLPDVVHCENGGAPLEALKAQAVAARTYLYDKLETSGSIGDGQGDQVYSCGTHATALEKQAVRDTAGVVLRYASTTIAAFFVAGGTASPPACHDTASSTSGYVTYNAGKSGASIQQTSLGLVDPSNARNRGCMSQLGSRCLASEGKSYEEIVRFYYGDDIGITQATGACVPAPADAGAHDAGHAPDGSTGGGSSSGGSSSGGDPDGAPSYRATTEGAPLDVPQDGASAGGCSAARAGAASRAPQAASRTVALALCALLAARVRRARRRDGREGRPG